MRVPYDEVFEENPDGSYTPRSAVRIGGVTMGPGVAFSAGVMFSGVDIAQYVGRDLDVEKDADGTLEIRGVYKLN